MTDLSFASDDEGRHLGDGEAEAPQPDVEPASEVAAEDTAAEPDAEPADDESRSLSQAEAAEGSAALEEQATQDALFTAEVGPTLASVTDDAVTSFGGPPDDLEAVRADLGEADEPEAPQEAVPAEDVVIEPDVSAEAVTVTEAAQDEASAALVEAGVPEGADDDADAVEALLDAEAEEGLFEPEGPSRTMSLPFFVYDAVWLVFAIVMVAVLRNAAVAGTLDSAPEYPIFVLVGLVLTVIGPLMSVVVWLLARSKADAGERRGLLAVALLRGSLATFAGVALWWAALVLLNYFKTGRFF